MKHLLILSIISLISLGCGSNDTKNSTNIPNTPNQITSTIRINEILANNKSTIKDSEFGKYSDYIELYNSSDKEIDISGFGLSDKVGKLWKVPSQTKIAANSYLLIWADGKKSGLHTDFKLSSEGEELKLYDKDNKIIDTFSFKEQYEDIATTIDDNNNIVFIKPSPNQENNLASNIIDTPNDTVNTPTSDIYINEFLARNIDTTMDEKFYQFSNWIELYNSSNHDIDISHYKLSDDEKKEAWSIPSGTTINAKSYKIIWVDKKDTALHTNFSLSSKGESILLFNDDDVLIDKVNYKKQKKNISYGRNASLTAWGFMYPSFNKKNQEVLANPKRADKPDFKLSTDKRTVTITTTDNSSIYYTTDGSTPTKSSSHYSKPLKISSTSVIKAVAFKDNFLPSKVETETYFRGTEDINLPTVSLSIDNKYLFDDTIGIYTDGTNGKVGDSCYAHINDGPENYKNYNQDWDRPVFIEYFKKDGTKAFNLGADISISGQCSRYRNKKKSFSIDLDSKYGEKSLKYPLYSSKPNIKKVKDFKLRTGRYGFDITDALAGELVKVGKFNIDYQAYKVIQMFVNGRYWGIYNIREKKGKNYIKSNYPKIKSMDIIAHNMNGDIVKSGDKKDFNKLFNYIKTHDLATTSNYKKLLTMIEEDSFIDYMTLMLYTSSGGSWLSNNVRFWKEKKEDAKWRWMLDDVDGGFSVVELDSFDQALHRESLTSYLFRGLLKNKTFKDKFKRNFNKHISTTFREENILPLIDKLANEKKAYMHLEPKRWDIEYNFDYIIEQHKNFANKRLDFVKKKLNQLDNL